MFHPNARPAKSGAACAHYSKGAHAVSDFGVTNYGHEESVRRILNCLLIKLPQ